LYGGFPIIVTLAPVLTAPIISLNTFVLILAPEDALKFIVLVEKLSPLNDAPESHTIFVTSVLPFILTEAPDDTLVSIYLELSDKLIKPPLLAANLK